MSAVGSVLRIAGARRRSLGATVALGLVALTVATASAAAATSSGVRSSDTSGRHVTRYAATYTLQPDGDARVSLDLDYDFGNEPGHGPTVYVPIRQAIEGDDKHVRSYPASDFRAWSSTGAPSGVIKEESDNWLVLKIGDADQGGISGAQSYHVEYTLGSVVNTFTDHAELYWNVVGAGDASIPLADMTVDVVGPEGATRAQCYSGPIRSTLACDSADVSADGTAIFSQRTLAPGNGLTVIAAFPLSAFPDAAPLIIDKPSEMDPVTPTPVTGGLALLVAGLGAGLVVRRVSRTGRDRQYLGLTPGLLPASGQDSALGYRDRRTPVSVQFTPPPGVSPGELGTLLDEVADPKDVTATIIDLAVRGYLRIEEVPPAKAGRKPNDWTLIAVGAPGPELKPFETTLLHSMFDGRPQVTLSSLKTTFSSSMSKVQNLLYEDVTANGWFSANPSSVRTGWRVGGGLVAGLGLLGAFMLPNVIATKGISLVPIALVVVGLVMVIAAKAAPARTAAGTAVLAQSRGFELYLTTAEANQLVFEEGEDLFSRYLPYAIVFGVAERWARIFGELAAQGRAVAEPSWYGGYGFSHGLFWASYASFGSNLDSFTNIATQSIAAPTPGSSGGSGFSGGFSGGGGGGGGVGGW